MLAETGRYFVQETRIIIIINLCPLGCLPGLASACRPEPITPLREARSTQALPCFVLSCHVVSAMFPRRLYRIPSSRSPLFLIAAYTRLLWLFIILWCELGVFYHVLSDCKWPTTEVSSSPHLGVVNDTPHLPSQAATIRIYSSLQTLRCWIKHPTPDEHPGSWR